MAAFEQVVEAKGHLIDSGIMTHILDRIIEGQCTFKIERFTVGRTNEEESTTLIRIQSQSKESLEELLDVLVPLGCYLTQEEDARTAAAHGPIQGR